MAESAAVAEFVDRLFRCPQKKEGTVKIEAIGLPPQARQSDGRNPCHRVGFSKNVIQFRNIEIFVDDSEDESLGIV